MATPKLLSITALLTRFQQGEFSAVSDLLNAQPSNSFSLTSSLRMVASKILSNAHAQPLEIDSNVSFYGSVAAGINPDLEDTFVTHTNANDHSPYSVTKVVLKGSELLAEHLATALWDELNQLTRRVYTPDTELDRSLPASHYYDAFVSSSVLVRAFTILPSFRTRLWRVVEEWIVRGIFSGTMQAPADILVTTTLVYGAGEALREYLGTEKKGTGKMYSMWTYVRLVPEERWGWYNIVSAVNDSAALIDPDFGTVLPRKVRDAFSGLGEYIGDGRQEMRTMQVAELELLLI